MNEPFSPYAKFHYHFLGYSFKIVDTGLILRKGDLWERSQKYCESLINAIPESNVKAGYVHGKIMLVDSIGWANGCLIK